MKFYEALLLEDEVTDIDGNGEIDTSRRVSVPKNALIKVKKKHKYRDHRNQIKVKVPTGYGLKKKPDGTQFLIKKRISGKGEGPKTDSTIEWDAEEGKFVYVIDRAKAMKLYRSKKLLNKRTAKKRARSAAMTRRKNKK